MISINIQGNITENIDIEYIHEILECLSETMGTLRLHGSFDGSVIIKQDETLRL